MSRVRQSEDVVGKRADELVVGEGNGHRGQSRHR